MSAGRSFHATRLRRFLSLAPGHARRYEARLKLGVAYVRRKQYDQARETFRGLVADRVQESAEAMVWLARVYLRQGLGDKLIELARSAAQGALAGDQRASISIIAASTYERVATAARSMPTSCAPFGFSAHASIALPVATQNAGARPPISEYARTGSGLSSLCT